jgi:1,4-alpha-glucan branching enzyme
VSTRVRDRIAALVAGEEATPFEVLGPRPQGRSGGTLVRAFVPGALAARVAIGRRRVAMERVHEAGVFEAVLEGAAARPAYKLELDLPAPDGGAPVTVVRDDPYRFGPVLGELDLHLMNEGTHLELADRLGAHVQVHERAQGVAFAVWAPGARRVSVVGNFNRWNPAAHPMRLRPEAGVWELFVPGLGPGEVYKFALLDAAGRAYVKADPFGRFMERRPQTASIVVGPSDYAWKDAAWMNRRARTQALDRPIAIYEVHAGSWRRGPLGPGGEDDADGGGAGRFLSWAEMASELVPYAKDLGYTHLELMPITEHPLDASWGYQTVGYFAPTSRFGTPDDLRAFIDAAHRAGLGVILDWAPAHFPKDAHGLQEFDGTHLYEHADPRQGHHPDWGTSIFNYGRPQVAGFLTASALYWLEEFHVDGLRVDGVASMLYLDYSRKEGEWLPNEHGGRENLEAVEFLRRVNALAHERVPGALIIAEESTSWPGVTRGTHIGGLGFDLKWNLGWMHDTLEYMRLDPIHRRFQQQKMTFSLYYAWNENYLLPLSHDEVVHGKYSLLAKMPGSAAERFAGLRALFASMYAHPGKKLLFMGGEFGQWREWSETRALDWGLLDDAETGPQHRALLDFVRELNAVYRATRALFEIDFHWEGFEWIDYKDVEQSVLVYQRKAKRGGDHVIAVGNYTPVARHGYRIGVPRDVAYEVFLNSDDARWGGEGSRFDAPLLPTPGLWQGQAQAVSLLLPPLSVLYLRPVPSKARATKEAP